jgi:hypoxanthine phosphoribosyltransferase
MNGLLQHLYPSEYEGHFEGVLLEVDTIRQRVRELAHILRNDFDGRRILLVCILKGAATFTVHLMEALHQCQQGFDIEFLRASSYEGTKSTGRVEWTGLDKLRKYPGRDLVIVEDILDTGTTLSDLMPRLNDWAQPRSVSVCTLLDRRLQEGCTKKCGARYVGFSIPDGFIVGYGIDYNELYRDLADIFVVSQQGIDFDRYKLYGEQLDNTNSVG